MNPVDESWEERIERGRRLRDGLAAGDVVDVNDDDRELLVDALGDCLSLEERHFARVRRQLRADLEEPTASRAGMPPGPWRWQVLTPEPSRFDPDPEPHGVGIVASDGTWVLWVDGGYGSPSLADTANQIDPEAPSPIARALAAVPELLDERADVDDAVLEVHDLLNRHGHPSPLPETSRDIVWQLAELIERRATDAAILAADHNRLWGLAGPDATVSSDVAKAFDHHLRPWLTLEQTLDRLEIDRSKLEERLGPQEFAYVTQRLSRRDAHGRRTWSAEEQALIDQLMASAPSVFDARSGEVVNSPQDVEHGDQQPRDTDAPSDDDGRR